MKLSLEQLSARMRQGETIPSRQTAQVALALSIPSILEQLVVTAMGYIDAAMVGHIGAEATASIGIVSSSTWLLHGVLVGLYTALSIQIAQYLGADRQDDARSVLRQAMLFNVIGWAVRCRPLRPGHQRPFCRGGWELTPPCGQTPQPTLPSGQRRCPSPWPWACTPPSSGPEGYALTASLISVLVCVLDAIFNFFLINPTRTLWGITVWGAGLGVPGAALGTALATVVGGLLALWPSCCCGQGPLCIRKPAPWKITRSCLRNLLWVGGPLAGERAAISLAQVVVVRIVAGLGTVAIAANSLAVNAEGLCYMAGYGIQSAAVTLIGQAVGANRKDMAKRFAWLCTGLGMGVMALSGVGLWIFAPTLMSLFTTDAAVIALGAQVLRIEAWAEPMFGASIVASGAMQGAGDSTSCFVLNIFSMWCIRLTLAFLLAPRLGLMGVWGAMCCELSIRGLLFLIRLARGKWLEKGALS